MLHRKQTSIDLSGIVLLTSNLVAQRALFGDVLGLRTKWSTADAHVYRFDSGHDIGFFEGSHHPEAVARLGGAGHGVSHLEFRVDPGFDQSLLEPYRVDHQMFADGDGNLFHL